MKKYLGFTLIEMLIVMGIIIILMSAGIAGGRFALRRANRIQKQSSVANIEQALWGYYSDYRSFPNRGVGMSQDLSPQELLTSEDYLLEYLDAGEFDGGAEGSFWYFIDPDYFQEFVVCASFGGIDDAMQLGIYCSGNGIGAIAPFDGAEFPPGNVYMPTGVGSDTVYQPLITTYTGNKSDWDAETRSW
jgi:type II secretory pathway pseudopilin PulG